MSQFDAKKVKWLLSLVILVGVLFIWLVYLVQQGDLLKTKKGYEKQLSLLQGESSSLNETIKKARSLVEEKNKQAAGINVKSEIFQEVGITKTKITIEDDGGEILNFIDNSFSYASVLKKVGSNLYVALTKEEQGALGYEVFNSVYRVNLDTKEISKLRFQKTMPLNALTASQKIYVNDISTDGKLAVYVAGSTLIVEDIYTGNILQQVNIPLNFTHVGSASFSPMNDRVAYAVTDSYEKKEDAKSILYVLDIKTGQTKELFSGQGGLYLIKEWQDNDNFSYELFNLEGMDF